MKTSTLFAAQKILRAQQRAPQARVQHPVSAIPNSRWVNAGFQGDVRDFGPYAAQTVLGARQFDPRARARAPQARAGHPYLTIPNSRWVNAGLQGFGYEPGNTLTVAPAFCNPLKTAMADLGNALEAAYGAGLQTNVTVMQAAAVFDSNYDIFSRLWLTFGDQCTKAVREVTMATGELRGLLASMGVGVPAPVRPNYDANKEADDGVLPGWVPWAIGGVAILAGLAIFTPYLAFLPKPK